MTNLAGPTSAKTPMFVLGQGSLPVHRSVDTPTPRNVTPVPRVVWLSGKRENRNYSRQLGSHLRSGGLSLPLLGNCGAADAAWPAGVTPGRYLAMTVGSRFATAL